MHSLLKFLVVDDNPDSRFLLVKTILRKFPGAALQETQEANTAIASAKSSPPDVAIVHRAADVDGLMLVRLLRRVNETLPIVLVSGIDRSREAAEAGANTFLNYDEWLRIGTVVATLMGGNQSTPPFGNSVSGLRVGSGEASDDKREKTVT